MNASVARFVTVTPRTFYFIYYAVIAAFVLIAALLYGTGAAALAFLLCIVAWMTMNAGIGIQGGAWGRTLGVMGQDFQQCLIGIQQLDALLRVVGKHTEAEQVWAEFANVMGLRPTPQGQQELAALKAFVVAEHQRNALGVSLAQARAALWNAMRDPYTAMVYVDNVAMLLNDKHGIKDFDKRNAAAKDIIHLLFADPGLDSPQSDGQAECAAPEGGV